jgi:polyribonucleotide nucleotidyltransferase
METTKQTSLTDMIIEGLKKAAAELEEFRVQAALGKMEAKDLFEEIKKKLNAAIHDASGDLDKVKELAGKHVLQLKTVFDELRVQLALGKADTREIFEAQRKKINATINDIETIIKENKSVEKIYGRFLLELKKFQIMLQILKLRFELRQFKSEEKRESGRKLFHKKIAEAKEKLQEKEKNIEKKWRNFSEEMHDAFGHLKTAFSA